MRRICAGIVAENSAIWRVSGVFFSTASTSSMKPMRSISSASSSTRQRSCDRSSEPRSRWSMTRPGVPTTTCTPRLSALQLRPVALAAVDRQHVEAGQVRGVLLERLGDLDRQLARRRQHQRLRRASASGSMRARIGSANAAVLPVPVCAWPSTSRPCEQRRDGGGLDRRGRLVADVGQGAQQRLRQAEVGEFRADGGLCAHDGLFGTGTAQRKAHSLRRACRRALRSHHAVRQNQPAASRGVSLLRRSAPGRDRCGGLCRSRPGALLHRRAYAFSSSSHPAAAC